MKSKEIFALLLRVIGVIGILYEVRLLVRFDRYWAIDFVIVRVVYILIGLYFIRGGSQLVKWAYPKTEE
jgi:hypothetical protein